MGQILSRACKLRRKTKCRKKKQKQPDRSSQAVQAQVEESASPVAQPQHKDGYQPASVLMRLPLDIQVKIFDLLDVPDAVAYSIACKGLYHHFFSDARALFWEADFGQIYKVWTMLEKDLPHDQTYCLFCKTFHTLDKEYRRAHCAEKDNPDLSLFATHMPGAKTQTLSYLDARAAVNAVFFKRPSAKSSLKALERTVRAGTPDSPWTQVWKPNVIDGELFLRIATGHDRKTGARDRDEFAFSVCKHVHINGRFPHLWVQASELRRTLLDSSRRAAAGSCRNCRADWKLWMEWIGGAEEGASAPRAGWDILVQSWHRLGRFRAPGDLELFWALAAGEGRPPKAEWIEGDSKHIIDHDGWESQVAGYPRTVKVFGPAEIIWRLST